MSKTSATVWKNKVNMYARELCWCHCVGEKVAIVLCYKVEAFHRSEIVWGGFFHSHSLCTHVSVYNGTSLTWQGSRKRTPSVLFCICSWRNKLRQWFGQVACYLVFHCDIWSLIWNFTQSFFYAEMYYSHWHRISNQSASVEGHKPLSLTIKSNMEDYMVWSAYFLRELGACICICGGYWGLLKVLIRL